MRILHVIQEMDLGGAERVVVALANAATREGHEVAVAAAPGSLLADVPGPHFALPLVRRSPARAIRAAAVFRRAARSWRPDVVHTHNPTMAVVAAPATSRGRRPPSLVSVHGVPDEDWRATARLLRLAGLHVVACGRGVDDALAEHGCRVNVLIPNGIPPAPPAADRRQLVGEWGLSPEHRLVLAVGRLTSVKNHALAVRALVDVPDAALVILGDGPLRGELTALARRLGVADRVRLPGARADAPAVMGAADVVVLPSAAEGLPLALLEALAAGVPVVATAVRGMREVLEPTGAALLVPAGDPDLFAGAVTRVLGNRALAAELTEAGQRVAERYTEERMTAAYLDVYRELLR